MELAQITFWQVATLFLLILTGFVSVKTRVVSSDARGILANLLLYVIMPCMVVNSFLGGYDESVSRGIGLSFLFGLFAQLMGFGISFLFVRGKSPSAVLTRFGGAFPNAAYMGFPLIQALFGQEGLMYAGAYVTVFNILLFTLGGAIMNPGVTRRQMLKEIVTAPAIWAVALGLIIYYGRIPVPQVFASAIGYIGGMNTPVSMMMTGIIIASSSLGGVIREKSLYGAILLRLVLVPAVCVLAFTLLGMSSLPARVVILLEACPCAAVTSVFAVRYRQREDFAGALVVISTLLSIATLPLCAMVLPG